MRVFFPPRSHSPPIFQAVWRVWYHRDDFVETPSARDACPSSVLRALLAREICLDAIRVSASLGFPSFLRDIRGREVLPASSSGTAGWFQRQRTRNPGYRKAVNEDEELARVRRGLTAVEHPREARLGLAKPPRRVLEAGEESSAGVPEKTRERPPT